MQRVSTLGTEVESKLFVYLIRGFLYLFIGIAGKSFDEFLKGFCGVFQIVGCGRSEIERFFRHDLQPNVEQQLPLINPTPAVFARAIRISRWRRHRRYPFRVPVEYTPF